MQSSSEHKVETESDIRKDKIKLLKQLVMDTEKEVESLKKSKASKNEISAAKKKLREAKYDHKKFLWIENEIA